jgi:hypothetical protein
MPDLYGRGERLIRVKLIPKPTETLTPYIIESDLLTRKLPDILTTHRRDIPKCGVVLHIIGSCHHLDGITRLDLPVHPLCLHLIGVAFISPGVQDCDSSPTSLQIGKDLGLDRHQGA